jgi:hypothetical protein
MTRVDEVYDDGIISEFARASADQPSGWQRGTLEFSAIPDLQ